MLFVFLLLSCKSFYIVCVCKSLIRYQIYNNFPYSVGGLFTFFMVSFTAQNVLILMKTSLSNLFWLLLVLLVSYPRNHCLTQGHKGVITPMFSSKSFICLALVFRYLIHLEIIFGCGVVYGSNFVLLRMAIQLSQHHLLKRPFFSPRPIKLSWHSC